MTTALEVSFDEYLEKVDTKSRISDIYLPLGIDGDGEVSNINLCENNHGLFVGKTGSGVGSS